MYVMISSVSNPSVSFIYGVVCVCVGGVQGVASQLSEPKGL